VRRLLRDRSIRPKKKAVAKKRSAGMEQGLMKTRHDTLVAAKEDSTGAGSEQGALADFAEDLGRLLGSAERKATTWLDQRKAVGDQLAAIRDNARALGVEDRARVVAARVDRALESLEGPFEVVFVDPPYADVRTPSFAGVLEKAASLLAAGECPEPVRR
jgi:hypothetical protein